MTSPDFARVSILSEIAVERERQVSKEGWTLEHDDEHTDDELAFAAAAYLLMDVTDRAICAELFPWSREHWEKLLKKTPRERLVIAGALIVAEIERRDRNSQRHA